MLSHILFNVLATITLLMPVSIQTLMWTETKDSKEITEMNVEENKNSTLNLNSIMQDILFLVVDDKIETETEVEKPVTTMTISQSAEEPEIAEEPTEIVEEPTLTPEEEQAQALTEWKNNFPDYESASHQVEFIKQIAPAAVLIANAQGIYPSVMIAQAALESSWGQSGLAQNYNNLMGTKGNTEGASVTVRTREDQNGESIYINAGFTIYDSWAHSLFHYGSLMKDGLSWDSEYYSGTWIENTESYKDATAWLQGRYASDTAYASKLNQTIESFDLAEYDKISPFENDLEIPLKELNIEE